MGHEMAGAFTKAKRRLIRKYAAVNKRHTRTVMPEPGKDSERIALQNALQYYLTYGGIVKKAPYQGSKFK